jgi:uncharacterized protein (DUF885 family)
MKTTLLAGVVILVAGVGPASPACLAQTTRDEAARLHRLFDERFEWEMREFPEAAMQRGDYRHAHRITDGSLDAIERRHRDTVRHLETLRTIDRAALSETDLVSFELFELKLSNAIADHRFRGFLSPIGQRSGPHQTIPQMAERVRFVTATDYENYIRRLLLVPRSIDDTIARLELGLEEARTPPQVAIRGVSAQLAALLDDGGLDALGRPFDHLPSRFTTAQRETIPRRFEYEAVPAVREALARLRSYFDEEYLPRTRRTTAATALPDGEAYYAHQLRKMTTTDLTAREIHELGLAEVARIRREMMDVIRRTDFIEAHPEHEGLDDDGLFAAFVAWLRADPRFYYDDPEALLTGYRDICKRVDAWLPKLFGTMPRLPYGVRAIPDFMAPQQTTAYYSHGSIENGEPGWFYANTYGLDQRPKYEMIALAMHEAVPGHHLQSAIAQELEGIPEFRKHTWFNAFGEGWALYSERLGLEMGLYEDPYDDFGRLLYEMWRACRLVVDPGMHAFGWTREQAIEYMRRNTALSELNITNEIDRYIAWPGQACGYKIGEIRIRRLRAPGRWRCSSAGWRSGSTRTRERTHTTEALSAHACD